ncbi:unnamed protein product [Diatraea saccharalis]|uniref:MADF domain-containing protein n=1 Tax=Diatraea saccharalis TaxID=40085 RepID=A0A9N9WLN9_9NEOP|nr:unnamed protein product [Diatraea saccharalis]
MDGSDVVFPRKLLKRFIQLYKELPCLWDRTCPSYKLKQKRHDAISKLTKLVQEYDPTATRVHVLRKIESLRACVRREYKRVRESRQKATSPDEVYTPQLWYFDLFSFVFHDSSMPAVKTACSPVAHAADSAEEEEIDQAANDDASFEQQTYPAEYKMSMVEIEDNPSSSKRYSPMDEESNRVSKRLCTEIEDEYDAIGVNVAAKLRTLPPNMRIIAEKLINDVLFQAQVNGLNSSTVISTSDPFK